MVEYIFCPQCGNKLIAKKVEGKKRKVCSSCSFIRYLNPVPSVGILVIENDSCLFIKRGLEPGKGTWAPPSGYVEIGETLEEAAARELKEETGLSGEVIRLIGNYTEKNPDYGEVLVIVYQVKVTGGELKAGDDAVDAKFFPLDKLPHIHFESFIKAIDEVKKSIL